MISPTDLRILNEDLALHYGLTPDRRPIYRVAWSAGQTEKRFGTFNEFCGPIFLREVKGVKEVPKYNDTPPRYLLERIFWIDSPELVLSKQGIYEAVWHFVDKYNRPLPPVYQVCQRIIKALESPLTKRTEADDLADELKAIEKEKVYFEDYLNDTGRASRFYDGAGVFVDSTKVFRG